MLMSLEKSKYSSINFKVFSRINIFNAYVPALRATLPGRAICKTVPLSRPVLQHGVRAAYLSGKPSRYRSLFVRTSRQALSHGYPFQGRAQHTLRRQRATRLAYLCRLCSSPDPNCTTSVCRRRLRDRTRQHRLRTRCINHRSMSFGISLGAVPFHKICRQTSYTTGSAGRYLDLYSYLRWQTTRCQCPRYFVARSRRLLCHLRQVQHPVPTPLFQAGGQIERREVRPDHCSDMDCHLRLCVGRHHQKAPQSQHRSLHNITDSEPHTFRESSFGTDACKL